MAQFKPSNLDPVDVLKSIAENPNANPIERQTAIDELTRTIQKATDYSSKQAEYRKHYSQAVKEMIGDQSVIIGPTVTSKSINEIQDEKIEKLEDLVFRQQEVIDMLVAKVFKGEP